MEIRDIHKILPMKLDHWGCSASPTPLAKPTRLKSSLENKFTSTLCTCVLAPVHLMMDLWALRAPTDISLRFTRHIQPSPTQHKSKPTSISKTRIRFSGSGKWKPSPLMAAWLQDVASAWMGGQDRVRGEVQTNRRRHVELICEPHAFKRNLFQRCEQPFDSTPLQYALLVSTGYEIQYEPWTHSFK